MFSSIIKKGLTTVDDKPVVDKSINNITYEELKHNVVNDINNYNQSSTNTDESDYYLINESIIGLVSDLTKDFSLKGFFDTNVDLASLRTILKDNVVIKKIKLENENGDDDYGDYFDCD